MTISWLKKLLRIKCLFNIKSSQKCIYKKNYLADKRKIQHKNSKLEENFFILFGPRPSTNYKCQYNCRFVSNDPNLLKKHVKKYHSLTNNNFVCPYCNASFKNVKNFEIHKVIYCTATNNSLSL